MGEARNLTMWRRGAVFFLILVAAHAEDKFDVSTPSPQASGESMTATAGVAADAPAAPSSVALESETGALPPSAPAEKAAGVTSDVGKKTGCSKGSVLSSLFRGAVKLIPDLRGPCGNDTSNFTAQIPKRKSGNASDSMLTLSKSLKPPLQFRADSGASAKASRTIAAIAKQEKEVEAAAQNAKADQDQAQFELSNATFKEEKRRKLVNVTKAGLFSAKEMLRRLGASLSSSRQKKMAADRADTGNMDGLPQLPAQKVAFIVFNEPKFAWYTAHEKQFRDALRADLAKAMSIEDESEIKIRDIRAARAVDGSRPRPSQAKINVTFTGPSFGAVLDVFNVSSTPAIDFASLTAEVKPDFKRASASAPFIFSQRCGGHGKYIKDLRQCNCDSGWTGVQCTEAPCSGHGTFAFDAQKMAGVCECDNGWFPSVPTPEVIKPCSKHRCKQRGIYDASASKCSCQSGWAGSGCETKVVTPNCDQHGSFEGAFGADGAWHGECKCMPGYATGPGGLTCVKVDPAHHPFCSYNGKFVTAEEMEENSDHDSEINTTSFLQISAVSCTQGKLIDFGKPRGRKRKNKESCELDLKSAVHDVRCCKPNGGKVAHKHYGCHRAKTYCEAQSICTGAGLRLCTAQEIKRCRTCLTGCGFDFRKVWTSTGGGVAPVCPAGIQSNNLAVQKKPEVPPPLKISMANAAEKSCSKGKIIDFGHPQKYRNKDQCVQEVTTEMHAVRCCKKDGGKTTHQLYGCHPKKTYCEAEAICEVAGLRLCTAREVKDCKTCGTGCFFDNKKIWTSTGGATPPSCTADSTSASASAGSDSSSANSKNISQSGSDSAAEAEEEAQEEENEEDSVSSNNASSADAAPGMCVCNAGFAGERCEKSLCNNQGLMDESGICVCNDGWTGASCTEHICNSHGQLYTMLGQQFCRCSKGWSGRACDKHQCSGHGRPISDDQCSCDDGWSGLRCEISKCSGHGKFAKGSCICDVGFAGSDCSMGSAEISNKPMSSSSSSSGLVSSDDSDMPIGEVDPIKEPTVDQEGQIGRSIKKP